MNVAIGTVFVYAPEKWDLLFQIFFQREAAMRHVVEFPLDMLLTVVWPVTIAIVIKALASPAPSAEPDGRVPRPA